MEKMYRSYGTAEVILPEGVKPSTYAKKTMYDPCTANCISDALTPMLYNWVKNQEEPEEGVDVFCSNTILYNGIDVISLPGGRRFQFNDIYLGNSENIDFARELFARYFDCEADDINVFFV